MEPKSMLKKFIDIQEPGNKQSRIRVGNMDVHETEARPWGLNTARI